MVAPLEVLAFAIGIKPALRIQVARADGDVEAARWRARGAAVVAVSGMLYVARDEARARALEAAEAIVLPGRFGRAPDHDVLDAHRALGRLLGYPPCCVDGFLERVVRGVDVRADGTPAAERVVAAEAALARSRRVLARPSFLLPKRRALVPFDPCAFDCEPALAYADALFAAYRERDRAEADALRAALLRDVRLASDGRALRSDDPAAAALEIRFEDF
ncbi:MAG: hypothetical protein H6719_32330 [Sandaracinaceae bacterium]|nr:hypothetical protein [Sandaracinaceae bacterium]